MSDLRIEEHKVYNPDLAADYDALLTSLHLHDSIHVPAEVRAVCESATTNIYFGMIDGHAAVMASLILPTDSIGHRTAIFEDIAVQEAYRGRGLGEKIVEHLIAESVQYGATRIELHSKDVRVAAHGLYKKFGFEIVDTRLFRKDLTVD